MIELMVILAITAILATIAVPSFTSMLDRRAIDAQANRLVRSINLARSKAVTGGQLVSVTIERSSATANDWSTGWRVYVDADANPANAYNAANDQLLSDFTVDTRSISILSAATDRIMFTTQGRPNPVASHVFAVCDATHSTGFDGTLVTVSTTGRISTSPILAASKAAGCVP